MKKTFKIIGIVLLVLIIIYGAGCLYFKNNIMISTTMYNNKINNFNEQNIKDVLKEKNITLILPDKRNKIILPFKELDYKILNTDNIKQTIINTQNFYQWPLVMIKGQNFNIAQINIDHNQLNELILKNKVIQNDGLPVSVDAVLNIDKDSKISITNEKIGQQLDNDLVIKNINDNLAKGN
ncbi:MAG: hypothetical protein LBT75_02955, partial [Bacilli bacterium]|nr:hypothetical protein [Bacilli bacterium]